ncbi:dihydrouridine synthase [Backusella circina FSU 941]|nr:dihydrouridine synthase [Backusella circina FSU 941]
MHRHFAKQTVRCLHTKPKGYDFYKQLGSPKYIVGPMVEQSEQAWRILCRRYSADLCYTPMFHARLFSDPVSGHHYRADQWSTDAEDRPLIVQFCANDPTTLLAAAKLVEHHCDGVDLNLGCPQHIARKGRYGSYLQDDWETIHSLISKLDRELAVPVTAKIRVFPSVEKTIAYAKMVEDAGAQLITVHGRLREQKGHHTGLADWDKIRAVKTAVKVPVFANGNIQYYGDLQRCLDTTGADGVMSAEGLLYNPALFTPQAPPLSWKIAMEYLEICRDICPTRETIIKSHLFKLFHKSLSRHVAIRAQLGRAMSFDDMWRVALAVKERDPEAKCEPYIRPKLPEMKQPERSERMQAYLQNKKEAIGC